MFLLDTTIAQITRDNALQCYSCWDFTFSGQLPYFVHVIYNVLKIGVPIILVIFGMIDFMKSVMAKNEEDIKNAQTAFIRRLASAIIVFFILFIVQILVGVLTPEEQKGSVTDCMECFLNGRCVNVSTKSCIYTDADLEAKPETKSIAIYGQDYICELNQVQYIVTAVDYDIDSVVWSCGDATCKQSGDTTLLSYKGAGSAYKTIDLTAKVKLIDGTTKEYTKKVNYFSDCDKVQSEK